LVDPKTGVNDFIQNKIAGGMLIAVSLAASMPWSMTSKALEKSVSRQRTKVAARTKIGNFSPMGAVDPKFQVEGVAARKVLSEN